MTSRRKIVSVGVGNFDADVRFAGHAIDANRFSFEREAQIIDQPGHARILHPGQV